MTFELRYLEKYSVAPAPSRDYYGIRILKDEVKLFRWKISHGPHRTPIVRSTSFVDFESDRLFHDEVLQVFGLSVLQYVRNTIAGKSRKSEEISCEISKGWNRVYKEGQLMQQAEKSTECQKKRCIRAKDNTSFVGAKNNALSKVRPKIPFKTPLEVIKNISGTKKLTDHLSEQQKTTRVHENKIPCLPRQLTDNSQKMLKLAKNIDKPKMDCGARSNLEMIVTGSTIDNMKEQVKLLLTPSNSTILKTGERLMELLSSVEKRNRVVDYSSLKSANKQNKESFSNVESYFSCIENNVETSIDTFTENYEIENPRSSDSSIASVHSLQESNDNMGSSEHDSSDVPKKNRSSYQLSMDRQCLQAGKKEMLNHKAKSDQTKRKYLMSRIVNRDKFSNPENLAIKALDKGKQFETTGMKNRNVGSSVLENPNVVRRTTLGLTKNKLLNVKDVSDSNGNTQRKSWHYKLNKK